MPVLVCPSFSSIEIPSVMACDRELTERGAAVFWRRDGDGGTAERGMGVLVKGRGDSVLAKERSLVFSKEGAASLFFFYSLKDEQGYASLLEI